MADRSLTSSALGARGGAPTPGRGAGATATAAASSRGVQQRASLSASVSAAAAGRSSASAMPTARERRAAVDRLDAELLSELKEAFQLFDSDEDGAIDAKELKAAFKALGVDVKTADVRRMLGDIGRDDGAGVDFDTFLELVAVRLPARDSPEEIAKVFALFDADGTGRISLRELKRVVAELGEDIGEDELRDMVDEADRDGDGFVTFDDFLRIQRKGGDPWASDDEDEGGGGGGAPQ